MSLSVLKKSAGKWTWNFCLFCEKASLHPIAPYPLSKWWTWSLQCCSTPSTAQKSSQVSQKGFQNKHGLLDSQSASAEPRGTLSSAQGLPWAQTCAAFCQLLLDTEPCHSGDELAGVSALMMHKPLSLPFAPSLLPKQENPADNNHQRCICIHCQKSHPHCTPILTIIIKEAFGLWPLLNWHRAVLWVGVKVWNPWEYRIWEAFRSTWDSGENWPQLPGQSSHSHFLIPSQQHHVANQKYKNKKNLMVEI